MEPGDHPDHAVENDEQSSEIEVPDSFPTVLVSPTPTRAHQNRPSVSLIPTVNIEMAATPSPKSSPQNSLDNSLLSPPEHRRFVSRPRTPKIRRPASAPPTIVTFDNQVTCFVEHWEEEPQQESYRSSLQDLRPGDLIRPTPLLCKSLFGIIHDSLLSSHLIVRPTTFWRKLPQSGVRSASYSPSSHLIRRSTFIAAGLSLDQPVDDISAFGVESRVGVVFLPADFTI